MSRFDGANEDDVEAETEEEPEPEAPDETPTTTESNTTTMSESQSADSSASEDDSPPDVPYNQPPQHPIHVPEEYLNEFQDSVDFEVKRVLTQEHNIRKLKAYEANTAMVRLAAANPEAITKLILDERGVDVDLSDVEI